MLKGQQERSWNTLCVRRDHHTAPAAASCNRSQHRAQRAAHYLLEIRPVSHAAVEQSTGELVHVHSGDVRFGLRLRGAGVRGARAQHLLLEGSEFLLGTFALAAIAIAIVPIIFCVASLGCSVIVVLVANADIVFIVAALARKHVPGECVHAYGLLLYDLDAPSP